MLTPEDIFGPLFDHAKSYFLVYKGGTCAVEYTATLLSLQCFSLSPLFLFSLFFCSPAAARRQEQHGQTGFLSLAVIHLSKCRSFPSTFLFFSVSQCLYLFKAPQSDLPSKSGFTCLNSCDTPHSSLIIKHRHSLLLKCQ